MKRVFGLRSLAGNQSQAVLGVTLHLCLSLSESETGLDQGLRPKRLKNAVLKRPVQIQLKPVLTVSSSTTVHGEMRRFVGLQSCSLDSGTKHFHIVRVTAFADIHLKTAKNRLTTTFK